MIFCFIIPLIYALWLYRVDELFSSAKEDLTPIKILSTKVAVIIAARNEALNIAHILSDLTQQDYPKELLEIILVDDASDDETVAIASRFEKVTILSNLGCGKKAAIETAVLATRAEWILTTDADCRVQTQWVTEMVKTYESSSPAMLCGAVILDDSDTNKVLYNLQAIEFHSLIYIGASYIIRRKPFFCNAANMGFQRQLFMEVGGYAGNEYIPSGDDEFLMNKLKNLGTIQFVKQENTKVLTNAQKSLHAYIQQRIRWASKHATYSELYKKNVLLIFGLVNLQSLILLFVLPFYPLVAFTGIFFKCLIDGLFIARVYRFLNLRFPFIYIFLLQFIYPIMVFIIAINARLRGYEWKGRNVAKSV